MKRIFTVLLALAAAVELLCLISSKVSRVEQTKTISGDIFPRTERYQARLIRNPRTISEKIVNGAKMEVINSVNYNASYLTISYPNGDVPDSQGACTDVVVRALRNAGFDLQKLIHQDMSENFHLYPNKWGLSSPDPNIDHRRVPNQMVLMERFGKNYL